MHQLGLAYDKRATDRCTIGVIQCNLHSFHLPYIRNEYVDTLYMRLGIDITFLGGWLRTLSGRDVPEPSTWLGMGMMILGVGYWEFRRRRHKSVV